jgi:hypothetical protein
MPFSRARLKIEYAYMLKILPRKSEPMHVIIKKHGYNCIVKSRCSSVRSEQLICNQHVASSNLASGSIIRDTMFYTIYLEAKTGELHQVIVEANGYTKKEVRRIYDETHPDLTIKKILIKKNFKVKCKEEV